MKNAILIFLAGILLVNFTVAQVELEYPRWRCFHNSTLHGDDRAVNTDEGFTCRPTCMLPEFGDPLPPKDQWIHTCLDSTRFENSGLGELACEEFSGIPRQCLPESSGGGGSDSSTKALIAGGMAIAVVAAVKYLAPETPEGVNVRPEANIAYRDGLAMSTAGIVGGWRNWEFSAVSANTGNGWTKPYARVQWSWVF